MKQVILSCLLLLLLGHSFRLSAQEQATRLLLTVTTSGTADPVVGAQVQVAGTRVGGLTDQAGRLRLEGVPAGQRTIQLRRVGYQPKEVQVSVTPGGSADVRVELEVDPVQLEGIVAETERRVPYLQQVGLYDRMRLGRGHFITREQLAKNPAQALSSVFRGIRGVKVERHHKQFPGSYRLSLSRGTISFQQRRPPGDLMVIPESCPVQYFLDGNYYPLPTGGLDDLSLSSIEAIEIFRGPSEVPAEYNRTDAACGVVLIWTRNRR